MIAQLLNRCAYCMISRKLITILACRLGMGHSVLHHFHQRCRVQQFCRLEGNANARGKSNFCIVDGEWTGDEFVKQSDALARG